ncbi:MAG: hypothetical protein A2140_09415 [Candidatus Muproteobacteria bacterium RBG_16_62_13]|uniref:Uncharacterized protein n=1 Tax=Candidatus Muproteobacteria bacterium RBG_16_62_13 TaxID=1817756 RepID=A0A1F6SZZ3_9PROT|nr:MAG: hypothetical protein A2140_09415 [Candidatus Muproteobacteria bacterium RBG_16_62_13]
MGVKRPGESDSDLAAVDGDLSGLDDVGQVLPKLAAGTIAEENPESVGLTAEELGHVAPGCFVQFGANGMRCWMEISRIEGDTISGRLHPELSNPICLIEYYNADIISIHRDQITALGCDRYCWC